MPFNPPSACVLNSESGSGLFNLSICNIQKVVSEERTSPDVLTVKKRLKVSQEYTMNDFRLPPLTAHDKSTSLMGTFGCHT
jgi:hypothetical protein